MADVWVDLTDSASQKYDGTTSGLAATDAQAAIDELASKDVFLPAFFYDAAPTASQVMVHVVATHAFVLPASLTGSKGYGDTAATAETTFDVRKNGASVGSIVWAAAGSVPAFSGAGASFAVGDRLKIVAPGTPDATLAGISVTLSCTR